MHWEAQLSDSWQASELWCGVVSSTLPNTGTLSLLQIQLICQVPSDVAFHFPVLSVLPPPPATLCFLDSQALSAPPIRQTDCFLDPQGGLFPANPTDRFLVPQAVSALPTPARSRGLTSRAEVSVPSPTQAFPFLVTVPVVWVICSVLTLLFRSQTYCCTLLCIWRSLPFG